MKFADDFISTPIISDMEAFSIIKFHPEGEPEISIVGVTGGSK